MLNACVKNGLAPTLTFARPEYDQVVETLGAEEADKNISFITSGDDAGVLLLPVAGRRSLRASFALNESAPTT